MRGASWVALVLAGLVLPGSAGAQERPPLRFCVESLNLPMAMPHPDRGIEVDLARALAERLGREAVFVWRGPGSHAPDQALLNDECDVAPGAVTDPAPLARGGVVPGIALSRPYAAAGYLLVRRADAAPVRRLADIEEARIGVEMESVAIYTLKQRGHRVYAVDDYDAVLRAVAEGHISYGYIWGPLAAWLLRDRTDVRLASNFEMVDHWNFSLATRQADAALAAALDQAIEELVRNGEMASIFASYGVPYMVPQTVADSGVSVTPGGHR